MTRIRRKGCKQENGEPRMAKARHGPTKRETLSRYVVIPHCRADISVRVDRVRGRVPIRIDSSTIAILGNLHQPLDGEVSAMVFFVCPLTDDAEIDHLERQLIRHTLPQWNIALKP